MVELSKGLGAKKLSSNKKTMAQNESCLKCQACCKQLTITTNEKQPSPIMEEFYMARGEEFYYDDEGYLNVVIKERDCKQLTPFGCKIYDNRPLSCRLFYGADDHLLKDICFYGKESSHRKNISNSGS